MTFYLVINHNVEQMLDPLGERLTPLCMKSFVLVNYILLKYRQILNYSLPLVVFMLYVKRVE